MNVLTVARLAFLNGRSSLVGCEGGGGVDRGEEWYQRTI